MRDVYLGNLLRTCSALAGSGFGSALHVHNGLDRPTGSSLGTLIQVGRVVGHGTGRCARHLFGASIITDARRMWSLSLHAPDVNCLFGDAIKTFR